MTRVAVLIFLAASLPLDFDTRLLLRFGTGGTIAAVPAPDTSSDWGTLVWGTGNWGS